MKSHSWLCWLLAVLTAIGLAGAQYKFRRLPVGSPPLSPQIYKKSWAPGARAPPIGNSVHSIPPANYMTAKRPPIGKPNNYRRPPPTAFNRLPMTYKVPPPLGGNFPSRPHSSQRITPVKDFHSAPKVAEYVPKYHTETLTVPEAQRIGYDDETGPIHTIPAPNLGPTAGKLGEHRQPSHNFKLQVEKGNEKPRRPYLGPPDYSSSYQESSVTLTPHRSVSVIIPSSTPAPHHYEVTEPIESNSISPSDYYPASEFDSLRLSTNQDQQPQQQIVRDQHGVPSQHYTSLPNRETAETLAALAAAGNVNSQLLGHLKKQQEHDFQADQPKYYTNHKEESDPNSTKPPSIFKRYPVYRKTHYRRRNKLKEEKPVEEEQISTAEDQSSSLRILVPEDKTEEKPNKEIDNREDYDYENYDEEPYQADESSSAQDSEEPQPTDVAKVDS